MLPLDELERLILTTAVAATRALPIAWMLPPFGGRHVPAPIRIGIGLCLALLGVPRLIAVGLPAGGAAFWILLLAREAAVGVTFGFVGAALFRAAESAGRLADGGRGAGSADELSPLGDERTSPLGTLYLMLAVVIFFELGGPGHVARALASSYDALPLGPVPLPRRLGPVAALMVVASVRVIEAALGLAAPVLVALVLADLVLGGLARVAPQLPVQVVGMSLKALLGIGALLVGRAGVQVALEAGVRGTEALLGDAVGSWR